MLPANIICIRATLLRQLPFVLQPSTFVSRSLVNFSHTQIQRHISYCILLRAITYAFKLLDRYKMRKLLRRFRHAACKFGIIEEAIQKGPFLVNGESLKS